MQVMANSPLLPIADFQNFTFQTLAFGDITSDPLYFHQIASPLDQTRADFQLDPQAGSPRQSPIPPSAAPRL